MGIWGDDAMKIHFVSTYNELLPDGVTAEQITVVVPEFSEVIQNLNRTFNGCRLMDDDVLLIQNRWGDHEVSLFER